MYQNWQQGVQYGYPRTFQVNADVGHGGTEHFIALNSQGTIEVLEIPTILAPTVQPRLYVITKLVGQGADLIPATVSFSPMRSVKRLDMQVTVYNGQIPTVYMLFNDGTKFIAHL